MREFYPAALGAFGDDLGHCDALAVLKRAPTPALGKTLTKARIASTLRSGGRKRDVESRAEAILMHLRSDQLQAPPLVAEAFGAAVAALVAVLTALGDQLQALEEQLASSFKAHPDAEIIRSLPGLGVILGARVLAGPQPLR